MLVLLSLYDFYANQLHTSYIAHGIIIIIMQIKYIHTQTHTNAPHTPSMHTVCGRGDAGERCRSGAGTPILTHFRKTPSTSHSVKHHCRRLYAGNDTNKARGTVVMCYNMAMEETKIRLKTLHHHPPALHHPHLQVTCT